MVVAAAARKFELYNNVTPLSINPLEWNVSDNEKSKMFQHTGGGVKGAVFLRLCRLFRFLHKFRLLRMLHWPHTCACPFVQTQITREMYAEGKPNLIFQSFQKGPPRHLDLICGRLTSHFIVNLIPHSRELCWENLSNTIFWFSGAERTSRGSTTTSPTVRPSGGVEKYNF